MSSDSSPPGGSAPALLGEAFYTFSPTLMAMEQPAKSEPAVAIQQMGAQLIARQIDAGRRGVAVCAPNFGVGASLVCVNLAIAISQAGVSVLLVDGNMHQPEVEKLIAPSQSGAGLQQLLRSENMALAEVVHADVLPGLSIVYSGGACSDASELVGGFKCAEVIGECLREYEYTIVDTPPANRSADARRLAAHIGYGLIVARRNRSYVDDVATLAGELSEDRALVIGTIYNDG
jgi:tyrosine-protein kinase Etk/Wzc